MPVTNENWTRPAKPPKGPTLPIAPPVTNLFPCDWQDEPGDWETIEADMIEAMALLIRRRDGLLRRHEPLSRLAQFKPTGCEKPISAMSATELALHVEFLRDKASRKRAMAQIEADMAAAE